MREKDNRPGPTGREAADGNGLRGQAQSHREHVARRRRLRKSDYQDWQAPLDLGDVSSPSTPATIVNSSVTGWRCHHCQGETFLTKPAVPPHGPRLDCVSCGKFAGWLPKRKALELRRAAA
jgi:hypothetical protein